MSKQKTVVVSIPHSENRNFTQDDKCQGDEACMDTQTFSQDLGDQDLLLQVDLFGGAVFLFLIFTSL